MPSFDMKNSFNSPHTVVIAKKFPNRRISDDDIVRIRELMLDLDAKVMNFKAALDSYYCQTPKFVHAFST